MNVAPLGSRPVCTVVPLRAPVLLESPFRAGQPVSTLGFRAFAPCRPAVPMPYSLSRGAPVSYPTSRQHVPIPGSHRIQEIQ